MKLISLICALIVLISAHSALAQELAQSELINDRLGLPQAFVSAIVQDRQGFIWVATRDGLCRYDGQHFRLFQPDPNGQPLLSFAVVFNLHLDSYGQLWSISKRADITISDPLTEKFIEFSHQPACRKVVGQRYTIQREASILRQGSGCPQESVYPRGLVGIVDLQFVNILFCWDERRGMVD